MYKYTVGVPGVDEYMLKRKYSYGYKKLPYKSSIKIKNNTFNFGNDNNNQPPTKVISYIDKSKTNNDSNPYSNYKYNKNFIRENTRFDDQKKMNHAYDKHAKKCFGFTQNRNKKALQGFIERTRSFIESPNIERIKGYYRHEIPCCIYTEKGFRLLNLLIIRNLYYLNLDVKRLVVYFNFLT